MKTNNLSLQKTIMTVAFFAGPLLLTQPANSQSSPLAPTPEAPETTSTNRTDLPIKKTNDPFANTIEMIRKVTENNPVSSTINALTGSMNMRLRGAVIDGGGKALALVEVADGQVHVVQVGDSLSLKTHGRNSTVKIMAINRQSIEVEFGEHENYIIVR